MNAHTRGGGAVNPDNTPARYGAEQAMASGNQILPEHGRDHVPERRRASRSSAGGGVPVARSLTGPSTLRAHADAVTSTGLSVTEHQHRTVTNLIELRDAAPDLPIVPVVQGHRVDDYLRCVDLYLRRGVDLSTEPLVGLGSVCRRQATGQAERIITALREVGVTALHGFGIKTLGLRRYGHLLVSADSMAWSYAARRAGRPLPGCTGHRNCANCRQAAYPWHTVVSAAMSTGRYDAVPLFPLTAAAAA